MSLNLLASHNSYVCIDDSKTSIYSLDLSNNKYYSQMVSFYKKYQPFHEKNKDQIELFPDYDIWKDVQFPDQSFKNIPHLFHINFTTLYSYSNTLLDQAYQNSISPIIPDELYPIATRYIDQSGNYFIERPPFQLDVDYKIGGASSSTKKRVTGKKIWIPWTLFIFNPNQMGSAKMYFSHKSLTNESDIYVSTYLPNTYNNGDICFSNSLTSIPDLPSYDTLSINQIYSLMINEFFAGAWNADLSNTWTFIYNNIFRPIDQKFSEDIDMYPQLCRLFNPSNADIVSVLPSTSKASKILLSYSQSIVRLSMLDYPYFHEYMLSMLSSFSLQDTLELIEELSNIYTSYIDSNHKYYSLSFKEHFVKSGKNFNYIGTFSKIKESVINSHYNHQYSTLTQKIINQLSSFPVINSLSSEFHNFQANILVYNDTLESYYVDSYYLRPDGSYNYSNNCFNQIFSPMEFSKLVNMIIQDSINGSNIQNIMYCFDTKTKEIHTLPYSFELYKQIVTDSSRSAIDILGYINDKV